MELEQRDWSHFALLLVDVQQSFWPGVVAPDFPDFPANVARLLALCRAEGLEIIHVRSRFKPDKSDWMLMYRHRVPVSHHPCVTGQEGEKPVAFAAREPGELVVFKQTFDALHTPNLVPYLRENDKRVILVAGLLTSVCVLFTAASAAQLGFLAAVVEDCCADRPEKHEHMLDEYQFMFDRTTTDAICEQHSNWLAALAELDGHGFSA
ncbi:MAG: isochorismatase family cysteine hydrolase [Anaerolineales bacterium]|jgi:nicotinamidase-related amidase